MLRPLAVSRVGSRRIVASRGTSPTVVVVLGRPDPLLAARSFASSRPARADVTLTVDGKSVTVPQGEKCRHASIPQELKASFFRDCIDTGLCEYTLIRSRTVAEPLPIGSGVRICGE